MESNDESKYKTGTCYYFNDIMTVRDIDFDKILLDEKSLENILIYDISSKLVQKICVLGLIKQIELLKFIMELDIWS